MTDLGDRERGLFRDWAVRKQWVFGEKPEQGAAATAERPVAEERDDPAITPGPDAAPVAPKPEVTPAEAPSSSPAASVAPPPPAPSKVPPEAAAGGTAAPQRDAGWDPEPVARQAVAPQRPVAPPTPSPVPATQLSHVNERGEARMVDVGAKADTEREAIAEGFVTMQSSTLSLILGGALAKGDVLAVARVAGVMAAKRTSDLIPMCHPLPITGVIIDLLPAGEGRLRIQATVRTTGKTGVEMEALTAVSVTALTVYDMAKAVDRGMRVEGVRLLSKTGGKSGDWQTHQ